MEKKIKIHLNTTSNILKFPEGRKQISESLEKEIKEQIHSILDRMEEIPSFIADAGDYSYLLNEAIKCYEFGLYYATISMIGITAEKFTIQLSEKINFNINREKISLKELFDNPEIKQQKRLFFLNKSKIISDETYKKLVKINGIRNKYIHPKKKGDAQKDSLEVLKLFIEIINKDFGNKYEIKEGKFFLINQSSP